MLAPAPAPAPVTVKVEEEDDDDDYDDDYDDDEDMDAMMMADHPVSPDNKSGDVGSPDANTETIESKPSKASVGEDSYGADDFEAAPTTITTAPISKKASVDTTYDEDYEDEFE